jgi:phi13 family phage major tail protein
MAPNQNEYKSTVGVDQLYIAEILEDSAAAYTADTPQWLAPLANLSQEPAVNSETQYADNQAYDAMSSVGETAITATITNLPAEMYAAITGSVFDATTGRVYENEGAPPEYALGFRSLKSNGKYRYYWFPRVKFGIPKEEAATKTDTPEFKTRELVITALKTIHQFDLGSGKTDSIKRVWGDEDTTNFSGTTWFDQVQVPGVAAVDPLALSASDPADAAPGVAVDKTVTLTFNNKLTAEAVKNVVIVKADGSVAAAAVSVNEAGKIISVNPDPNLAAGSTYIVTYAVVDIYGQALAGAINFGTA